MMAAESLLPKRPVLRFTLAVLFFLFSYLRPIIVVFRCYKAMFVCIYVHSADPYCFFNLCRKLTYNFTNAFCNRFSLKADTI